MSNTFPSLDSIGQSIESAPIGVSFSCLEYTNDSFLKNIKDNTFSIAKIKSIIATSPDIYFNYDNFRSPMTRPVFQELWTNKRFLEAVRSLLNEDHMALYLAVNTYRRDINTIAYDYYYDNAGGLETVFFETEQGDSSVLWLLMKIVNIINANDIIRLSARIPRSVAEKVTMAYYGTFDRMSAIYRLNTQLINYTLGDPDLMTPDLIVYIYYIFFSSGFSELFCAVMIDKKPKYDFNPEYRKLFYDKAILAILSILNSMPSVEIRKVLTQYSSYLALTCKSKVRTSLQKLPEEFARIAVVVKECGENGYYVP